MTALPTISLIFVNYRSLWALTRALESLAIQEGEVPTYEVIVVNNDEREARALTTLAKQFSFRLLQAPKNEGFGAGVNRGVEQAEGIIIGILNPDTCFREPLLRKIQSLLTESPQAVYAPTLVRPSGEQEADSFGLAPTLSRIFSHHLGLNKKEIESPEWMSGAALFLTKERFLLLRGFDPEYFLYFEDVDFCLRAKSAGSVLVRLPETLIHVGGQSFPSRRAQKSYYYRAQRRYFETYRPQLETQCLRWLQRLVIPGL